MTKKSIHIDALRGCAIFAVVQYHYGAGFSLYPWLGLPELLQTVLSYGWAGVDLFFVLSAYLLTRNLLSHRETPGVVETFYRRRILRILPLYLALLAAAAVVGVTFGAEIGDKGEWMLRGAAPFPVYATFLQNFWIGLQGFWAGHFLAPTWSLAVEEHFYLLLPLIVLSLDNRRLAILGLAMIVAGPFIRLAVEARFNDIAALIFSVARVDSFGWGILAALALQAGDEERRRFLAFWEKAAVVAVIGVAGLAFVRGGGLEKPTICALTAVIAARLVVAAGIAAKSSEQPPGPILSAAAWMGVRCYSIYLLHMPVVGLMTVANGRITPRAVDAVSAVEILAAFAVTLVVSNLSYRFIEQPFIAYGERKAAYRERAAQGLAT